MPRAFAVLAAAVLALDGALAQQVLAEASLTRGPILATKSGLTLPAGEFAVADLVEATARFLCRNYLYDDGALAALELGTFRVESASPMGRRLGVGLEVGWPTAVTGKLMLRPQHAVRASLGAFSGLALTEPSLSVAVDWLYHPLTIAKSPAWTLHAHVGAGGTVVVLPILRASSSAT